MNSKALQIPDIKKADSAEEVSSAAVSFFNVQRGTVELSR